MPPWSSRVYRRVGAPLAAPDGMAPFPEPWAGAAAAVVQHMQVAGLAVRVESGERLHHGLGERLRADHGRQGSRPSAYDHRSGRGLESFSPAGTRSAQTARTSRS